MPLDNKISNIFGAKIAPWVLKQLKTRSVQNSKNTRDNDNLLYLANKTAWVRLVSSVNITDQRDREYFKNLGVTSTSTAEGMAQEFTLFGGTSLYVANGFNYQRAGLGKSGNYEFAAYGILGQNEIKKYGYRPMPGITSVSIETQGRLGSVRAATINFKCWSKDQLDVIDALYFKLGFTMFLEWGHVYYYPNPNSIDNIPEYDPNKIRKTELDFTINPFEPGLDKETIFKRIAENSRKSNGNYDAMLGMATNFNFSFNQEGGYDCTLKIISLGVLGESIKINNTTNLPDVLQEAIVVYTDQLAIQEELRRKKQAEEEAKKNEASKKEVPQQTPATFDSFLKTYSVYNDYKTFYPSNKSKKAGNEDAGFTLYNLGGLQVVAIRGANVILPAGENDFVDQTLVSIDGNKILNVTPQFLNDFSNKQNWVANVELIGSNLIEFKYEYVSRPNGDRYGIFIEAESQAFIDEKFLKRNKLEVEDVKKISVSADTTIEKIKDVLSRPGVFYSLKRINPASAVVSEGLRPGYVLEYNVRYTRQVEGVKKVLTGAAATDQFGRPIVVAPSIENIDFLQKIRITFDDSYFISGAKTPSEIKQPLNQKNISDQDTGEKSGNTDTAQNANPDQTQSPLKSMSNLELVLRSIQVTSLIDALNQSNKDPELEQPVRKVDLTYLRFANSEKNFLSSIFSNGVFGDIIYDLIFDNNIDYSRYNTNEDTPENRFKVQAKYGFAANLMANKESLDSFPKVDFTKLLTTYVLPYEINQSLEDGTPTNHPVYIPLGLLLMILNNNCSMYDVGGKFQTPLVYIDFNPELNLCLSNLQHLSTDPFTCLIPFQCVNNSSFYDLFDSRILTEDKRNILPLSGSDQSTPIFTPFSSNSNNRDNISDNLLSFKSVSGNSIFAYQGQIMNILLNIDYVMSVIKNYATNDTENKVFLKPFIEQILSDVAKSTGNFNIFRLSYNDQGNTYQVIDDQLVPPYSKEQILSSNSVSKTEDPTNSEIPLFGKNSIAKSLEIRTDVSSKLSSMIAISANADVGSKSTLSYSGDVVGYINTKYVDRYIPNRQELTGSFDTISEGLKNVSIQFNSAISAFYNSVSPSKDQAAMATNYYIEKMTKIKGADPATRASAVIPVSLNFTTDGISGLAMGQAFTVSDEILPYTYNSNRIVLNENSVDKVGFAIVGLTHTIDSNSWNTAVRANMIFLKDENVYRNFEYTKQEPLQQSPPTDVSIPTTDENGNLAKWERGRIVGYEKGIKYQNKIILQNTFEPLKKMIDAAQSQGVKLKIESAYRSYNEQLAIRKQNVADKGREEDLQYLKTASSKKFTPETGAPGYSNHQNGVAFDLLVQTAEGKRAYEWLVRNAINYGFIRTVPGEKWHWEWRPGLDKYSRVANTPKNWNYDGDANSNTA